MLFFINIFKAFYLQENQSKKYVKIQPNSTATLVLDKNKATDFVPFKMTTNLAEFTLKSKKSETYFDKIDDFGNLGGTKIIPESDYFSILVDLNLTNQLKKGNEYVYYDTGSDLFKLGPFNEEVHKGFEIIPRKSDKKHIELLKERAKELESLKNKYESKEIDSKPKEEKLTPKGFVSTE